VGCSQNKFPLGPLKALHNEKMIKINFLNIIIKLILNILKIKNIFLPDTEKNIKFLFHMIPCGLLVRYHGGEKKCLSELVFHFSK
jgi:hypothetical protein